MYEYRVVAAPTRGVKAKGIKGAEARFSNALEVLMNEMAADGWEYQRAETLPSVERSGLTSTTTTWRNVLVFRRMKAEAIAAKDPVPAEMADNPVGEDVPKESIPKPTRPQSPDDDASQSEGATRMLRDNGVEETSEVSGMTNSLQLLARARKSLKPDG